MRVTLRAATADDAPQVAEVLLTSRRACLPHAPLAHGDEDVRRWVREELVPSGGVTVACAGRAVVGVLATGCEAGAGWIHQLDVAPGHVGRGIGSRLLAHALRSLPTPVRLYTFQANARTHTSCERHGFRAVAWTDGQANEERCPDVLFERAGASS